MHVTFSFAFSSRYAKTRTSNFHEVVSNIQKVWWEVLYGFCWKFTSLCSSERVLKIR